MKENIFTGLKIYNLSASYAINETMSLSFGRKINPKLSSVGAIDGLQFEKKFKDEFKKHDVKVMFSGRKTHLSKENLEILERITDRTKDRKGIVLNICFDYGSQTEITEAVKQIGKDIVNGLIKPNDIEPKDIEKYLYTKDLPKLDLWIRPSGEVRLSNFMLWQASYAELYFCKTYWPAFSKKDLENAILSYNGRDRRFGGLKKK